MLRAHSLAALAAALTLAPSGAARAAPVAAYETLHIANPDPAYEDHFGRSVAISGDVAIIGAYDDASGGRGGSGAAYLYDASTGAQITELTITGSNPFEPTGWFVGIDGGTAIVGTPVDEPNGAAYLFDVATGQQTAKLAATDGASYDYFGVSVDLSGGTAIVGAMLDDDGGRNAGAAYLFDASTGAQTAKLVASDAESLDRFGASVAIDGNTAIVGATREAAGGVSSSGAAYLFDASTGAQIAKLTAETPQTNGYFAQDVDISDGVAIVGAFGEAGGGAAYLFDAATGEQLHRLVAPDMEAGDWFGAGVAIEGGLAVVGAAADLDASGVATGALYVFDVATGDFLTKLVGSNTLLNSQLGASVDISNGAIVAGAPYGLDPIGQVGDAYIFDASAVAPSPVPLPAGLVLLVSSLSVLVLARRRQSAG